MTVPQHPEGRSAARHENAGGSGSKTRSWDWMTIFNGILAAFAAASFVALWIQLRDARKSFAADQRPYLWMANEAANPIAESHANLQGEKQVIVTMKYTNFGKSPAVVLRGYHAMLLGPNAGRIRSLPWVETRSILPTGKVDFFSAVSDHVSDQEITNYTNAQQGNGITVYATWQYSDTSGNNYETEFCMTRLNSGSWAYCQEHNDIKNCSESACEP